MPEFTHRCHACHEMIEGEHPKETRMEEIKTPEELQDFQRKRVVIIFTHHRCTPPHKIPPEKIPNY